MTRPGVDGAGRQRPWETLALWSALAGLGIVVGVLALSRNLERGGVGGRWRGTDATGERVDALLASYELGDAS